ncbi:hypothetical protein N0V86_009595 [Didymella sp. IMI 355093]|nr:hypothetical protein N0V86_009595 [Didymella sp. IMI 355093]
MAAVLYLEELFDLLLERTSLRDNARLIRGHAEWKAGSTLQLQRVAHENLGLGTWKRTDEAVPVTNKGDILGIFNIEDEKHARLEQAQAEMKSLSSDDSVTVDETPNGEIPDGADLGDRRLNVGGGVQYQRLPSIEHGSTW